jgi:PiT family inorganic phosphate transporter
MALGGVLSARRVAETMSLKITSIEPTQGLAANLVTCLLVTAASRWGLPVSTTHVAVGSLFGIGLVTGRARARTILAILLAWATTLPIAGALAAMVFLVLRAFGMRG